MTDSRTQPTTLLVDVELPDPEPIPAWLLRQLGILRVILVGWYALPEQTSPEQARTQLGEEADEVLREVVQPIKEAGSEVQTRLVFTPDKLDTIERISADEDCDALLIARPLDTLDQLLVPLRGLQNADRLSRFVVDLVRNSATEVTLLHVIEEEETPGVVQREVLEPMSDKILAQSLPRDRLHQRMISAEDQASAIIEAAREYDAVVIGETAPSIQEVIFGSIPQRIARKASVPVMLVRQS